jgi:hypothetical protein
MRRRFWWGTLSGLALVTLVGCGPSTVGPTGGASDAGARDAGDAAVARDASSPPGDVGVVDTAAPSDSNCGSQTTPIELVSLGDPPDMLIVLDRSGTMILPIAGGTRWSVMKAALKALVHARDGNIRFGLSVFPTDNACTVDPGARVPIALNNEIPISNYLDSVGPNGSTPAHFALQEALAYYQSITPNPAGRYVLFATDGAPNCGGDPPTDEVSTDAETVAAVTALANAGVHTFVLGYGGLLTLLSGLLESAAQAGLEPRPGGPPSFYQATNAAELTAALDLIAGGIIPPSCSYQLQSQPPVPNDVTVSLNGVPVPRSSTHTNGWDYYPNQSTITFYGTFCQALMDGAVTSVSFEFGCPGPIE